MVYTFGMTKHANTRYRDSFNRLHLCELKAMLQSLSVDCELHAEEMGGAFFLTFESRPLSEKELSFLTGHSAIAFMAEKKEYFLKPVSCPSAWYLEEDLPEILKYKGKTSASFTRMMINMACALLSSPVSDKPLTLLDPLCGKGTTCFCAAQAGMNAVGLDLNKKAVDEAADFFARYLKIHMLKHSFHTLAETFGSNSLPLKEYIYSDTKEHYLSGDTRMLRFSCGDTSLSYVLCRHHPADLLVTDLPYGVQHAPQFGKKPESFRGLLQRVMPEWKKALRPDGVAAVSFNTLTLPRHQVVSVARESGFIPIEETIFSSLRHEVEQAVVRDVVFMINKS